MPKRPRTTSTTSTTDCIKDAMYCIKDPMHGIKDPKLIAWKSEGRSYLPIAKEDLERLLKLAQKDLNTFIKKDPKYAELKNKIIAICLCQGAGLHYQDGKTGIRDFDVYTFFSDDCKVRYPVRRCSVADFGSDKFGKTQPHPYKTNRLHPEFVGRHVDLLARHINNTGDFKTSITNYLEHKETDTAMYLSQKGVVCLYPELGTILRGPMGPLRASQTH